MNILFMACTFNFEVILVFGKSISPLLTKNNMMSKQTYSFSFLWTFHYITRNLEQKNSNIAYLKILNNELNLNNFQNFKEKRACSTSSFVATITNGEV